MGSEMCIRDRFGGVALEHTIHQRSLKRPQRIGSSHQRVGEILTCLLYTSDAADERSSVDLGGRRIIKKKKNEDISYRYYIITTVIHFVSSSG